MSRKVRYWVSLVVALTFCIGLFSPAATINAQAAAELIDIDDHWAKDIITKWVEKGLVSGYADGTFKPDKSITRAEFMTLVNKAFGFSEKAAIGFSDVTANDWFYDDIAKAVKAGYISGYQDGTVKPNREISRQEAAVALCKALNLEPQDDAINFTDIDNIPNWSRPYIGALVAKGYMGGYPDGTFRAERHITRSETVTMLDKALETLAISYDKPGIYGPEENVETISQDVAINVSGVTLRNMIIEGDLYLNEGIGEGDVTLNNVTVKGTTTVRGGGKDSIHLVNFTCEEVIVIKVKVRIVALGSTDVSELKLQSGAHIEGKGFATVTILKDGEDVVLDGDFEEVIIEADTKVEVLKGTTIENLEINSKSQVDLASDATVKDLTIDAPVTITGKGTIETAKINADGAKLETKPKKVELAEDVTAEIAGKEVRGEEKKSSGGGGGGGGRDDDKDDDEPTVIEVQSVSLNMSSVTLAVYEGVYQKSATLTATIHPDNATNKKVTWSSSNNDVAIVTGNGLKATVEAVSEGEATITVKTDDGGKTAECKVTVVGDEIPVVPVSAISVEGDAVVGATLTAKVTPDKATVDYQWMRSKSENEGYAPIEGATEKTYKLVAADVGKYIKVKATGTGNYKGTVESVPFGPIAEELVPEVSGSIERDPGNTGGELDVAVEGDTVTFSNGEIKWYPADEDLGRAAGNRVGVQINAPADFNTEDVTVTIGENEYNWDEIEDGDGYFWWYPLVTKAGETFTATVVWNEASTQVFKVVISENVTLEPAPDTTDPKLESVSPEAGDINLGYDETFKLEVTAYDENLRELEVDHNIAELPEFSVYASESDPYGGQGEAFAEAGVTVTYNVAEQKWIIDFGEEVTSQIVANGGITFYLVLVDEAGNKWGSMDPTTPENTFAYTVTQDEAPVASTYKFSYEVPDEVIAGQSYAVPVTIEPETVGDIGYDSVRFNVDVTTPEGATLQLLATDTNEVEHDVAEIGYWGPEEGFPIDANYSATTDFTVIFSDAGEYTITFSLVDLEGDETLVTETVEITVPEGPVVLDGELVAAEDYTSYENWKDAITEDGIDFGQITQAQAIKMGIADPDYYGIAMYLKVGDDTIELNSDNLKSVVRIDPEGNEVEPQVTADNIYQFVHDGWGGPGEYTMRYTLKDGRVIEAKINVVSFEFKDEEPEVKVAEWNDTGKVGTNTIDGKAYVFQGFELLDGENRIDLVASNIESMTVLEPGATEPKTLTVGDDSDPLLWFNVQKATGDYKYTVVTKAGVTYVATLSWTAPVTVDAVKTGDPAYNQDRENWYQLYTVEVDVDPEDSKVYQIKPDGEISELTVLADADNHLNIWFGLYGKDGEQQEGEHIFLIKKGDTWSKAVIDYGLVEVTRADGDVTQDTGFTGGKSLEYDFVAEGKVLTIDAKNTILPYYEEDGSYPPRGANWVGVAIPVPADVETEKVSATINNVACTDLFFADGKYMEYIDVKDADFSEGAAIYTWVIKWGAGYADETITIKLINVAGLEAPEEEPETANIVVTGSYGIHDNKVYAGYELQDKNGAQIPLVESNIESMSVKDPDGNVTDLTVVGETDPYLWFNIAKEAGTYTYTVVTKGEESKTYKATLTWTAPTEAKVSFQAPESARDVFTEATDEAPAQVDFSKVTADKLLDWSTDEKPGYYAIELKIESVDLSEDNVKYAFSVYGDGTAIEPEIKGDLDAQYVTTFDWQEGLATMYYVLADGSLYQAKINVVSLTPATEVSGSIERDPANTGGELEVTVEGDTVTFSNGEIAWYPEDEDLGRAAGNRVGVQINAPADFSTDEVTVEIGDKTYNWNDIEDGDGYFWWYPLVTQANQQFTATVVWNEASTQEFKVVIGEGVTLEPAPDTTDPELESVSPEAGDINLGYDETFKLEVTAYDENLRELEVDHNIAELPEFSVYASESDPYGGQGEAFAEAGVTVTYNVAEQKWTIDFGETVTTKIVEKGGITFYLVIKDQAGNQWGSMSPPTEENTFAYNVTQEEVPDEVQFVWDVNNIEGEGNLRDKFLELNYDPFDELGEVKQTEVAKLFILSKGDKVYQTIDEIKTDIDAAINKYNELLGAVNASENVEAMKTALQAIGTLFNIDVNNLMAQVVLNQKPEGGYVSVSEIIAVIQDSIANVETLEDFKAALADASKTVINLTADFETIEKILVNRAVTINGNNHTITFTGDDEGWQGNYVLHVYKATDVTIKDIKLTGGDAALLVNGSEVTLTGAIDVSGNEFGGIESSKGVGVENNPKLTVTGATFTNTSEAYGLPTIWEDQIENTVVTSEGQFTVSKTVREGQVQYYLDTKNAEPTKPSLEVTGPTEEVAGDAENFTVTFAVTHDKELAYLEIDHNLGKHGSLPSEVEGLPEFKLYPNAENPWATGDMDDADARKQYAESQGLVATYDANEKTWTLTFGNPVLDQIRNLTAEYTNNEFKIYSLVCDVDGNQSGSMHDGSYKTTVVTFKADATTAYVGDLAELNSALKEDSITTICITNNISGIDSPIKVERAVTINGGNNALSFTGLEKIEGAEDDGLIIFAEATVNNLTVDAGLGEDKGSWVGTYAIHVYDTKATLNNVTATGGNGGILVNGSKVTLTGNIDVTGNGFGGIEVSIGEGLTDTFLDVTGATLTNTSEAYGLPTIWEDKVSGKVKANKDQFATNDKVVADQVQYYLDENNAEDPEKAKIEELKSPVDASNITTDRGTTVVGVTAAKENGKVTLTLDPNAEGFDEVVQKPNTDLGANEKYLYHEVSVTAPEGAKSIRVIKEGNFAESEIISLADYSFAKDGYVMTYYPVGYKNDDGENVAFGEGNSWTRIYVWYDADGEILRVDFLEVVRVDVEDPSPEQ